MNIEELINGFQSELDAVTNKDQAKAIAAKIIIALRELNSSDTNQQVQLLNDSLLKYKDLVLSFETEVEEKNTFITELQDELEGAKEVAADALERFNEGASSLVKVLSLKVSGKNVQVNHGVSLGGVNYSAADLVSNPAIVEELLEKGSGAVNVIEGK